ncbi:Lar family restriction alleviation protein [Phage vB_KsaM-C1]|nr:Lar family restriction alleviation protein [Phage vB_KsaM-C1]
MKDETLLPCPFCGGEPEEESGTFVEYYGHERQDYWITCKQCGAEVRCDVGDFEGADAACSCHHDTREICANKWNRRPIQSGNSGQLVTVPDESWRIEVEKQAEIYGQSFVVFRNGEQPQCADPTKIVISFTDKGLGHNAASDIWIPVSERMPDETQPVIVVAVGGVVQRTVYQFCDGVWTDWYEQYDEVPTDAITHWQPLPDAPKTLDNQTDAVPEDRLQKAIVDACMVFLHGCDSLSKNYECDFSDSETETSFCIANVAKKIGVVEETGNRRWSLSQQMRDEINGVYRKYAMRIMEAAPKVK